MTNSPIFLANFSNQNPVRIGLIVKVYYSLLQNMESPIMCLLKYDFVLVLQQ